MQFPSRRIFIHSIAIIWVATSLCACSVRRTVDDPIEPVNRAIFGFNEVVDKSIIEPVARGYDYITPNGIKRSIHNFFENLSSPRKIVSSAVQGKGTDASIHVGRFLINSTVGVLGLFDVAQHWELEAAGDDFGIALGSYNIGPGPYLVLPLLGPSNVRDLVGIVVDGFLDPLSYLVNDGEIWLQAGARGVKAIEQRRRLIDAIEVGRKSSLDYYTFVKSSYQQSRLNQIYDGELPPELRDPDSSDDPDSLDDEGWVIEDEDESD